MDCRHAVLCLYYIIGTGRMYICSWVHTFNYFLHGTLKKEWQTQASRINQWKAHKPVHFVIKAFRAVKIQTSVGKNCDFMANRDHHIVQ